MLASFHRILFRLFFAIAALAASAAPVRAEVDVSFHSFNGSFFGRYPHAFVVFKGTLDGTGAVVDENYGFSARTAGPAVLAGPVAHGIYTEKPRYIRTTNRHFTAGPDRKSTRLNSSHGYISYAVFCLKKKKKTKNNS